MEGVSAQGLAGRGRFTLRRELGRGAMGVIYEAFDADWGVPVAVKTLRAMAPEALLRLKNEFRAVEGIYHPNLVRLGELLEDNGRWLFTMELVDGEELVRWVRHDGACDHARLRDGLRQLVEALQALHKAGYVHRDIKPSNVLVTREGRVVLLDFGLVTRVAADDALTRGLVVGTAGYMAPEQAAGLPVTPSADWYAVGALMHEALTGALPRDGEAALDGVPADLGALCSSLLVRDPERRAEFPAIARALGLPSERTDAEAWEPPFVGRAVELAALHDAFAAARVSGNTTVFVSGDSGIGKSTLARRFVRELLERGDEVLVLEGHASDRELVPFNGFDSIIDGLARWLATLPSEAARALLPADADALAALFPVLARAAAIARGGSPADEPAPARRRRAFVALRELLSAIARRQPLV
ncbi:MAG TPA: serine/threonine-protein kinase, partial [Polyangia bacterium]